MVVCLCEVCPVSEDMQCACESVSVPRDGVLCACVRVCSVPV